MGLFGGSSFNDINSGLYTVVVIVVKMALEEVGLVGVSQMVLVVLRALL